MSSRLSVPHRLQNDAGYLSTAVLNSVLLFPDGTSETDPAGSTASNPKPRLLEKEANPAVNDRTSRMDRIPITGHLPLRTVGERICPPWG